MKKIIFSIVWIITIAYSSIWTYEHPEKIEKIKDLYKKDKKPVINILEKKNEVKVTANSFTVNFSNILEINKKMKTAFVVYPKTIKEFNPSNLTIYTQSGYVWNNSKVKKINLPSYFTLQRNGGVKTIISLDKNYFALMSGNKNDCYFASIISLKNGKEIFRTKCLPEKGKNNDFNGIGSSNIHLNDSIFFSLGTPEKHISKNSPLAQSNDSMFGKILELKKEDLRNIINDKTNILKITPFSKGHRVPQGLTHLNNKIFSTEHGPKGGDELNLIIKGKNYGWPTVSYGTNYLKSNGGGGKAISVNHEIKNFEEPLFSFIPSVGISALNNCPTALKNYYKKNCLLGLSLYGNNLRKGNSLIVFLLDDNLNRVIAVEKILLNGLVLRHFVTDEKNILYEDKKGQIYISTDKNGIYKIKFSDFR